MSSHFGTRNQGGRQVCACAGNMVALHLSESLAICISLTCVIAYAFL